MCMNLYIYIYIKILQSNSVHSIFIQKKKSEKQQNSEKYGIWHSSHAHYVIVSAVCDPKA